MPDMGESVKRMNVSGELIGRCQHEEPDAQQELFEQTHTDVHRMLYRLAGPQQDMEDLVQQVYLALFSSIGRFEGRSAFSTYLFGICFRVAKKKARSAGRFNRLRSKVRAEPVTRPQTPADQVAGAELAAAVHRALDDLPIKLRTVLVLFEMEGLSGKEIAELMSIKEATVWTRLHHARKTFRRSFKWETQNQVPTAPS